MEHLEHKQKVTIMIAIMAAMLFAALNQTIVGTALPIIVSDLGGMEYFNWVFTIYMLASSVTAILVGKLSDTYGRKPFILIGLGVFTLGSFLCGTSETIIHLIIYRGIQGLGGGMIMSTAFTAVGDLFPPRERGRWQGMMSGVFGLASVFGPTMGGYIVDHFNWNWVFWVFLPFGIIAFSLIFKMFPSVPRKDKEPVDYYGSIFLTCTIIPMLLAFSWAGNKFSWSSLEILSLFTVSFIALIIFILIERKVKSPVLPLHLFKNKVFTLSNGIGFLLGAGMFGTIMYVPFFVQGVLGTSATKTGFIMMPMTLSMVVASIFGGRLVTKTGKYKKLAILGLLIMGSGLFSMALMDVNSTNTIAVINMIIVGIGLGIAFPIFTLTVQNAVEHKFLGVATSSVQLFRQIGGTIGVAIMGSMMNNRMVTKMEDLSANANLPSKELQSPEMIEKFDELKSPEVLMNPEKLGAIRSAIPEHFITYFDSMINMLREAIGFSLQGVFFTGMLIILSGMVLTFFLEEIPLRHTNEMKKMPKDTDN